MTKKKINLKPYTGNLKDLILHGSESMEEYWFILFQGKPYFVSYTKGSGLHRTEALAKVALKKHIEAQFCQGHYLHKGKGNTFEQEGGWTRNNGNVNISRREFPHFFGNVFSIKIIKNAFYAQIINYFYIQNLLRTIESLMIH